MDIVNTVQPATQPLYKPLTVAQINKARDKDGYISGVIIIDLDEVIDWNREGFLNVLSEKLIGDSLLMDISYKVVGHKRNALYIWVCGDPSESIEHKSTTPT